MAHGHSSGNANAIAQTLVPPPFVHPVLHPPITAHGNHMAAHGNPHTINSVNDLVLEGKVRAETMYAASKLRSGALQNACRKRALRKGLGIVDSI